MQDLINNTKIEDIIKSNFRNIQCACKKCGYKNNRIISQTYLKIFSNITLSHIIFISFEFLNESDNNIKTLDDQELKVYTNRIQYNKEIIKYIFDVKYIMGKEYKLLGIINSPTFNHYNGIIISIPTKIKKLKLNKN
jgi:hypothetical protein